MSRRNELVEWLRIEVKAGGASIGCVPSVVPAGHSKYVVRFRHTIKGVIADVTVAAAGSTAARLRAERALRYACLERPFTLGHPRDWWIVDVIPGMSAAPPAPERTKDEH
jgi:hypothetical protein